MITAVDTNVIVALWSRDPTMNSQAQAALEIASSNGALIMPAPVFAELLACPGRSLAFLDEFCNDTGVKADWELPREIWIFHVNQSLPAGELLRTRMLKGLWHRPLIFAPAHLRARVVCSHSCRQDACVTAIVATPG